VGLLSPIECMACIVLSSFSALPDDERRTLGLTSAFSKGLFCWYVYNGMIQQGCPVQWAEAFFHT
jgi:hypothetical protein